jgi:hypothetical protein
VSHVVVDPAVQARYDEVVAGYGATSAEISAEQAARQRELDARLAADRDKLAEFGRKLVEATDRDIARTPDRRPEDNDVSARAEDYQELDEDPPAEPPPAPPPPVRQPRTDDEDEVVQFRWDDDPVPRPAARAPREEEDLSDHDWLR